MNTPAICPGPECDRPITNQKWGTCKAHGKQANAGKPLTKLGAPRGKGVTPAMCSCGCGRRAFSRGLCRPAYNRMQKKGLPPKPVKPKPEPKPKPPKKPRPVRLCEFPNCGRKHEAHGLCNGHGQQARRGVSLTPLGSVGTGPRVGVKPKRTGTAKAPKVADNMPEGWTRKTVRKERPAAPAGDRMEQMDFIVPVLPDEITERARRNLHALGADDLLDMLGLGEAA